MRNALRTFLEQLDYRGLAAIESAPTSALERYLSVRARIVLGEYAAAERLLATLPDEFGARFLAIQLRLFRRQDLPQCHFDLFALLSQVPKDGYWLGEYHLLVGYLSQLLDEYTQAAHHQQLAADHYRRASLSGCEAIAVFNLTVCHDHLNEREKLTRAFQRLETIGAATRIPVVELFVHRVRANLALDREDYALAVSELVQAAELCRAAKRWRDLGSTACSLAYLQLKLSQPLMADADEAKFLPEHAAVLSEYRALARKNLLPATEGHRLLRRWRKLGLDSVFSFQLADTLLERVLRAQEYEWVLRTAHQIGQLSLRRQQALSLIDLRHYEILCLAKLGRHARARTLWNSYQQDAQEWASPERQVRAQALAPLLVQDDAGAESEELVLDTGVHALTWQGRRIDLADKPLIEKFLAVLIENQALTLSELYDALYDGEYHGLLHGRRLHSLIDRTRRLLGDPRAIVRREGRISLAAVCRARVQHTRAAATGTDERRSRLLDRIRVAATPIALPDIASGLEWSRRTLQLDLKKLVAQGAVHASGRTRKRLYSYVETR